MFTKPFQKVLQVAAIALPLISMGARSALADPRDFTLVNGTGVTIFELYVSHGSEANWGSDILGRSVLPAGESTPIVFPTAEPDLCTYDIKVVIEGGREGRLDAVNLCTTGTVTFTR
jgi:hypothetical protein